MQTYRKKYVNAHAGTLQIIPALPHVSQMSPLARKKNISADEGGAASALLLGFLARFVSTKTLNIHRPSSDLRWLPCQKIASHFGALGVEWGGALKIALAFPMHNEWPETALARASSFQERSATLCLAVSALGGVPGERSQTGALSQTVFPRKHSETQFPANPRQTPFRSRSPVTLH